MENNKITQTKDGFTRTIHILKLDEFDFKKYFEAYLNSYKHVNILKEIDMATVNINRILYKLLVSKTYKYALPFSIFSSNELIDELNPQRIIKVIPYHSLTRHMLSRYIGIDDITLYLVKEISLNNFYIYELNVNKNIEELNNYMDTNKKMQTINENIFSSIKPIKI